MDILYFDVVGGIAGDMTVAALLELGVPVEALQAGLDALGMEGLRLGTERGLRHGISGTLLKVRWPGWEDGPAHEKNGHGGHNHRAYGDIRVMLAKSTLPPEARRLALAIFAKLAEAEAEVHAMPLEAVEFHEVGAWDSIADIVCTAIGIAHLAPQRIYCSPVPVGEGQVHTAHGLMPVPAPATLLLLRGFSIVQGPPAYERTTPTGAAILAASARPAPPSLAYVPKRVGIGLGHVDKTEVPNLLRVVLGEV